VFARLSPADRKIARALWEAQLVNERRLTLDEIAALRHYGRSWEAVVREMRAAGCFVARHGPRRGRSREV